MMTNLFSTFDRATSIKLSMNWSSSLLCMLLIPMSYSKMNNGIMMMYKNVKNTLHDEFKMLMGSQMKGMTMMMTSLFMMILINNLMGLLAYIFTSSSHLAFSLTLALPMWMSLMLFGWLNKTNSMFAHLTLSLRVSFLWNTPVTGAFFVWIFHMDIFFNQ